VWTTQFIVVRKDETGKLKIINSPVDFKAGRYFLQYIGLSGDALFVTPLHAKRKGESTPAYFAHMFVKGKIEHDEKVWKEKVLAGSSYELPAEP
jgi:hypothetical protein